MLRRNTGVNLCDGIGQRILKQDTKSTIHNKKNWQVGIYQN